MTLGCARGKARTARPSCAAKSPAQTNASGQANATGLMTIQCQPEIVIGQLASIGSSGALELLSRELRMGAWAESRGGR